ncbi:MAG: asparagine synthase C-terminal domain-containing protein [Aquimonas sp.]|nr:asparagine synthase C-terminal domain-containing protein [Aquimonas sp.]
MSAPTSGTPHEPVRELHDILGQRCAAAAITARFVVGRLPGEPGLMALPGLAELQSTPLEHGLSACHEPGVVGLRSPEALLLGVFDLVVGDPAEALGAPSRRPWLDWRGRFGFVRQCLRSGSLLLVGDHFGSVPLYYGVAPDAVLLGNRLQPLLRAPFCRRSPDPAAIFHYLNFGCVPAPLTIVPEFRRLLPGSEVELAPGQIGEPIRWWRPPYAEDRDGNPETLASELREQITHAVQRHRPAADARWGCFLSGGTDSSSVVTLLARQSPPQPVHSYSIGFAEADFDELEFARMAADACGAHGHFGRLDEAETLAVLPRLTELYDQPFGNQSAVPTRACAALAAQDGRNLLLAGDGGDEIFGGNERYAKDQVMQGFYRLPGPLKRVARGLGQRLGGGHNRLLNRIDNFTRRASLPNPDRFYTDDAFASEHFEALLGAPLASALAPGLSLAFMRETYEGSQAQAELHRLMALDLELAIAQNDLVKVDGACRHAGVGVRFPLLDPDLVAYTGRLKAHWKVRGLDKRHLFKQAMRPILPDAILAKRKQGFGLPLEVWIKQDPQFRAFISELLLSPRSASRGWFRADFVEQLLARHLAGAWDYSSALWLLAVLELWMRQNLDA